MLLHEIAPHPHHSSDYAIDVLEASVLRLCRAALVVQGNSVHLVGKSACGRGGRQANHIHGGQPTRRAQGCQPDSVVEITIGSDSDVPKLKSTAQNLEEFGCSWKSAHRTPRWMVDAV
ncbi:hypothetical protein BC830DRAFT_1158365 [Chytriomyces sp. MP71]|nr:hypothetical protein BC830DRAFT_1158365 [Chytriomyces sp. MP71]